ncbi:hypothetical protein [Bacillus sp. UNC322MFChir4.1]|nr:hypothetical protein [Bacillus sp. UNC322MFChir4.1]
MKKEEISEKEEVLINFIKYLGEILNDEKQIDTYIEMLFKIKK